MRVAVAPLLVTLLLAGCPNERPVQCQKLRQCCDAAKGLNLEVEVVRVQCTRKEDVDPVLCERRLADVTAAFPTLVDREECRLPPK